MIAFVCAWVSRATPVRVAAWWVVVAATDRTAVSAMIAKPLIRGPWCQRSATVAAGARFESDARRQPRSHGVEGTARPGSAAPSTGRDLRRDGQEVPGGSFERSREHDRLLGVLLDLPALPRRRHRPRLRPARAHP